jgi:Uma2 family endonuclease
MQSVRVHDKARREQKGWREECRNMAVSFAPTKRKPQPRFTREVAWLFPCQGEWTEGEYLALIHINRIVELSEGRCVIPAMPTDAHQYTVMEVLVRIHACVTAHHAGHVRVAPLPVRLWPGKFREPDIVVMRADHAERIGEEFWGVPDVVVEVISPRTAQSSGTERTDRREKFREYEQAEVAEYWLVDPSGGTIEVYVLRQGIYQLLGQWGRGEIARSAVLSGFEVAVQEVIAGL